MVKTTWNALKQRLEVFVETLLKHLTRHTVLNGKQIPCACEEVNRCVVLRERVAVVRGRVQLVLNAKIVDLGCVDVRGHDAGAVEELTRHDGPVVQTLVVRDGVSRRELSDVTEVLSLEVAKCARSAGKAETETAQSIVVESSGGVGGSASELPRVALSEHTLGTHSSDDLENSVLERHLVVLLARVGGLVDLLLHGEEELLSLELQVACASGCVQEASVELSTDISEKLVVDGAGTGEGVAGVGASGTHSVGEVVARVLTDLLAVAGTCDCGDLCAGSRTLSVLTGSVDRNGLVVVGNELAELAEGDSEINAVQLQSNGHESAREIAAREPEAHGNVEAVADRGAGLHATRDLEDHVLKAASDTAVKFLVDVEPLGRDGVDRAATDVELALLNGVLPSSVDVLGDISLVGVDVWGLSAKGGHSVLDNGTRGLCECRGH